MDANLISHINDDNLSWVPNNPRQQYTMLRPFIIESNDDLNYFAKRVFRSCGFYAARGDAPLLLRGYVLMFRSCNLDGKKRVLELPKTIDIWVVAVRFFEVLTSTNSDSRFQDNDFSIQYGRTVSDDRVRFVVRFHGQIANRNLHMWEGWYNSNGVLL